MNKKNATKSVAVAAIFAAIIAVVTGFPIFHIPIPMGAGYVHFGDSIIYIAACVLPPPFAVVAAGLGGLIADLISGYAMYAPFTMVIKILNAVPFIVATNILLKKGKGKKIFSVTTILMSVISSVITVVGYFGADSILYSVKTAIADVIPSLIQGVGSAMIFVVLSIALDKVRFKSLIKK